MKLTKNNLEEMVKEVLKESIDQPFYAKLPDEQTKKTALESEEQSTGPIIRFYENEELDEELDEMAAVGENPGATSGTDIDLDNIVQEEIAKYLKKKIMASQ